MKDHKRSVSWWGRCGFLGTAFLFGFSFPCNQVSEFAYFFAVPFLVWSYYCKSKKGLWWSALGAGWIGWLLTIFFLRHVWFGLPFVAGAYGGLYLGVWLFVASIGLGEAVKRGGIVRLVMLLGLAGLWVVLEWIRGWLFSGYPWLPLAASQWEKPVLLQLLPWTGAYGLSFILIFFNLAIASFIIGLVRAMAGGVAGQMRLRFVRCMEIYVAIGFLVVGILLFLRELPKKDSQEFAFKVGVVQTNIAPQLKWDPDFFLKNLEVLQEETLNIKELGPDLVIWPESAVPTALNEEVLYLLPWMKNLASEMGVPMLVGALARDEEAAWYNAIFEIRPQIGLMPLYYAKQKRVPFGEYVPLRKWLPFINKVVPTDFDLSAGRYKEPLVIEARGRDWKMGCLVCYEDIFAYLARDSVIRGAEFLLVVTNDAWYGAEGGAYQHASNSVLRAVECRRPVIRCGNDGWSGWIDEYGNIRGVLLNATGTIYMRGGGVFSVYRDVSLAGIQTFYVRYGDWFVAVCALLSVIGAIGFWKRDGV